MSPSDRMAHLYPQAPGSLFVAFCASHIFTSAHWYQMNYYVHGLLEYHMEYGTYLPNNAVKYP
jgi:hypothetical protein